MMSNFSTNPPSPRFFFTLCKNDLSKSLEKAQNFRHKAISPPLLCDIIYARPLADLNRFVWCNILSSKTKIIKFLFIYSNLLEFVLLLGFWFEFSCWNMLLALPFSVIWPLHNFCQKALYLFYFPKNQENGGNLFSKFSKI